jgi:hypothetical protein
MRAAFNGIATRVLSKLVKGRPTHDRRTSRPVALSNPLYIGMIRHRDELYQGQHQAAVSDAVFERVGRKLAQNAGRTNFTKPGAGRSWPFAGIAWCASCRKALRMNSATNRHGTKYGYIVCGTTGCDNKHHSMPAPAVEASIVTALATALAAGDLLEVSPTWAIGNEDGSLTSERAAEELRDAEEHLKDFAVLLKDRAIDRDDPDYLVAVERRDDAERSMDALSRYERSYRDEIARMAARIEGLALHSVRLPRFACSRAG